MKTDRLASITDGIIAIAATIMVLELAAPAKDTFRDLLNEWPIFLAHFNSFFLIYIFWYSHSRVFDLVDWVNTKIVLVNGIWLAILSTMPFLTHWAGIHINSSVPQFLYSLTFLVIIILFQIMFYMISKEYPQYKDFDREAFYMRLPMYFGLIIGMVIAFIMPMLTLGIVFIVIIYMLYLMLRTNKRTK